MPSEPQTPTTSVIPSDAESTQPTTPSAVPQTAIRSQVQSQPQSKGTKPAVPLVPIVPVIPQAPKTRRPSKNDTSREFETPKYSAPVNNVTETQKDAATEAPAESITSPPQESSKQTPLTPAPPKSWADLVRSKTHPPGAGVPSAVSAERMSLQKNEPIAEVLASLGEEVFRYSDKISFLEPRGLVNTGNMCYMNSVGLFRISPRGMKLMQSASNRFSRFWCRACHSINSWTTLAGEQRTVFKAMSP